MNSSSFQWFYSVIFTFLLTAFCSSYSSSPPTQNQISYADHCNSAVPESTIKKYEPALTLLVQHHTGYYSGGDEILSQKPSENAHPLMFRAPSVYKTYEDGVFGVEGNLVLHSRNTYYYLGTVSPRGTAVRFRLHGFWSEISGNLCMVGTAYDNRGKSLNLEAVLKLSNLKNSSRITTLVSGSLESLSSTTDFNYFERISILILPRRNYEYTLVSEELNDKFSTGNDSGKSLPLRSLPRKRFCSVVSRAVNEFNLKYKSDCSSAKSCGPFGASGYLPRVISFKQIECLEEEKRLRLLVEFHNSSYNGYYQPFEFNKTLVAEGLWDDKMNQLCVVACRFLNTAESLASAYIGDCTTRLSLSSPAIWSIREKRNKVGQIWSKKAVNDSGYFDKILFGSSENSLGIVPDLKYEYTKINQARKLCLSKKKPGNNKGKRYPNRNSYDMQFNIRVKRSNANSSFGYAIPLSVGDQFYQRYLYPIAPTSVTSTPIIQEKVSHNNPVNISYKIGIRLLPGASLGGQISPPSTSGRSFAKVEISAEGIYDEETGQLCMVGCRNIVLNNQSLTTDSVDCEILIKFQFPPLNPKKNEGYSIKGSIKSTRVESDPLYFEPLDAFSNSYSAVEIAKTTSWIDWEVVMALISNTLACFFVGLQLFHVKKHPEVLPSISLVMVLLLTLRHMIPLVLNFEAFFFQNHDQQNALLSNGGLLEVNEVLVRIITMVAFLLEFRLLQLSWSAKLADDTNQTGLWFAEKSTLLLSFPFYAAGASIFLLVNWRNHRYDVDLLSSPRLYPQSLHSVWGGLKSYAGLVLDGFLLPQILLNILRNSKENAFSFSFYLGTTFLRLLPHAYSVYYINADFSSDTWNVIICVVCLLFAAIIFLQQWFGGRFNIFWKFRDGEAYEKVPVVSES